MQGQATAGPGRPLEHLAVGRRGSALDRRSSRSSRTAAGRYLDGSARAAVARAAAVAGSSLDVATLLSLPGVTKLVRAGGRRRRGLGRGAAGRVSTRPSTALEAMRVREGETALSARTSTKRLEPHPRARDGRTSPSRSELVVAAGPARAPAQTQPSQLEQETGAARRGTPAPGDRHRGRPSWTSTEETGAAAQPRRSVSRDPRRGRRPRPRSVASSTSSCRSSGREANTDRLARRQRCAAGPRRGRAEERAGAASASRSRTLSSGARSPRTGAKARPAARSGGKAAARRSGAEREVSGPTSATDADASGTAIS